VLVVHQAEDVAERVNYGCRDEPVALLGDGRVLLGPECQHPLHCSLDIVDVPIDDCAGWRPASLVGRELAGQDAELVFVIADAELEIAGALAVVRAVVLRRYAEQFAIPLRRRGVIVSKEIDRAQSSQHFSCLPCASFLS
jgi:hypothetical protein